MKRLGPYSSASRVAHTDGRSSTARFLRRERDALISQLRGAPTPTQSILINSLTELRLRIHMMDRKYRETGVMTDCDRNSYLAWTAAATRLAVRLGLADTETHPDWPLSERIARALAQEPA